MKRTLFIVLIFLLLTSVGKSFALVVPPPPIGIDISNSNFEIIDSQQFRISTILAPGYPGAYWADFLWDPGRLLFSPVNVGEDTASGKIGVALVGKGGGYYPDPIAAMNDIATWCGTPSETNPCLVKILPGVYDIGSNTLGVVPYVDIEGSGENVTKIRGRGSLGVIGASFTEIRFLTVEHAGGVEISKAIVGGPSQKLTNVTIVSTAGTVENYGVFYQDFLFDPPPMPPIKMKNVTVIASGGSKSIGVYTEFHGLSVIIMDSTITGATNSIRSFNQTAIVGTQLNGPVAGLATCAGVYDENFVFYANTCP